MSSTTMIDETDFSWLHLSDFHIGKDSYAQRQIFEYILDEIKSSIADKRKPDFIFITGDLANKGKPQEYLEFDEKFVTPMIELLGDTYFDRIFIVPGNHDVDRSISRSVMRYGALDEIETFLDPTPEGLSERELLLPRFQAFNGHDWYFETDQWVNSADGFRAKKVTISDNEVGILCINTSWFCGTENEKGKLSSGIGMLESGLRELKDCSKIIVLGHHPIDWLTPTESEKVFALLGNHEAVYLHGHLHKSESKSQGSGSSTVTCLQAGCAFDSRSDDNWMTRILWAGYHFETSTILVQPRKWIPKHQNWAIDSDAFPDSLRRTGKDYWAFESNSRRQPAVKTTTQDHNEALDFRVPEGWVFLSRDFLDERRRDLSDDELLHYFDGHAPRWAEILCDRIPKRHIVNELTQTIKEGFRTEKTQLTLLLGAGGEGKSTAFLQALESLVSEKDLKILWRYDTAKELPLNFVTKVAASGEAWLIASDEGDSLVADSASALRYLRDKGHVHMFLACRDTDWIENKGNDTLWQHLATYVERKMRGLDTSDATLIISAWSSLGDRGLGKLANIDLEDATTQLVEAAQLEASNNSGDGAFLGAMLRVRMGEALADHVAALMVRLESREVKNSGGKTLLDAFSLIAAPHAINQLCLSNSVLANALNIEESRLKRHVLSPLGEEAAASTEGNYILTRHRAIAEAAIKLAESKFDIDAQALLIELVKSAITASEAGQVVPQLTSWRYLSTKVFDQGDQSLGVRLASAAVEADPQNSFLIVKLAQLYRQLGQAELSVKVFRETPHISIENRAYYTEWATCEGFVNNRALSIYISALSLSDNLMLRRPELKDIGFALSGALLNFLALYDSYGNKPFLYAAFAANQIARRINLPHAAFEEIDQQKERLEEAPASPIGDESELFNILIEGFRTAYQQRELEISGDFPKIDDLKFEHLRDTARL